MIAAELRTDTVLKSRESAFNLGSNFDRLHESITTKQATLGIIGLGYVGLPLGVAFAEAGFTVVGFDVNEERAARVNLGQSHIPDVASDVVLHLVDELLLSATADMRRLAEMDVISICVPTPLGKTKDPDISYVVSAAEKVAAVLRPGQLIVLESTTYPGTTREVILPLLEATGLRAGEDFFLAFSPERVDPGNTKFGIKNTPKVVGGLEPKSTQLATLIYQQAIDHVVPVTSPESAEMVKLLENTFRSVNIALANETALMCDRMGIDVWEVTDAAATKPFGFMPFYPGPGIGGHCIPLDPYYLSWKMKTLNYRARFIELAGEINAEMPHHVVNKVVEGLNHFERSVKGSNILVLGVAYKANIDDYRESPALDIIGLLKQRGANVTFSDPFVPEIEITGETMKSVELTDECLSRAECVVVVAAHKDVDYERIAANSRLIVDSRHIVKPSATGAILITI